MDNFYPNFYLYTGFLREKSETIEGGNTVDGIKRHCGALGLSPVRLSTEV